MKVRPDAISTTIGATLLFLLILAFSVSWLWPRPTAVTVPGYVNISSLYDHADDFFAGTWLICGLTILYAAIRGLAVSLLRSLVIFFPIGFVAFVASAMGDNPGNALTYYGYWFLIVAAGCSISLLCERRHLIYILASICALFDISSVLVSFFSGQLNLPVDTAGLFEQKQVAGWFYTISAVVFALTPLPVTLRVLGVLVTIFASWKAKSVSAMVLCTVGPSVYAIFLPFVRRLRLPAIASVPIFTAPVILMALLAWAELPIFTGVLGRDTTFETRTLAWPEYFKYAADHLVFGRGPGMFSGSWINAAVFDANHSYYYSTHNTYLTVLGETGIFGLLAYTATLLYLAFYKPAVSRNDYVALTGALALQLLLAGSIEPTIGFFPTQIGLSAFLIALCSTGRPRTGDTF